MKKSSFPILIIILFFTIGCTTINTSKYIPITYKIQTDKEVLIDIINYSLIDNGFEIESINEKDGIITTKWKDLRTSENTNNELLTLLSLYQYYYTDALKLSFKINNKGFTVYPNQAKLESTSHSFLYYHTTNTKTPKEYSVAGEMTNKIITQINEMLGKTTYFIWEENVE
ncbi:MAG: hypothetical protein ACPKNR_03485 [Pleomorphochaeta sp.]